jgi:predicted dehydrogenase
MSKATGKDIKVGVIGYGASFDMGRHHLREMQKAGMTPVAVCDIDGKRLAAAAQDWPGIQVYPNATEMLKKSEVELVAVVTPHNVHAPLALQCLNAGRHVVVEKPMAIKTEECDAMIAAAKKNKRMLSAYHNRHWDGCVVQAMKTVRSGALGEVYRVQVHMDGHNLPRTWWRARKSISGGILYDWGVHMLEYTLQIMDAKIVEVSGFAHTGYWAQKVAWKDDANEDEGAIVIRFENGKWATVILSDLAANHKRPWLEITGTDGNYAMEGQTYAYTVYKGKEHVTYSGKNPPDAWTEYYHNVAAHLRSGAPLVIPPEYARRPIHILDLACKSAAKGAAIKAKYA